MALAKNVLSCTISELSNSQFQLHLVPSFSLKCFPLKPVLPSKVLNPQFTGSRRSISQRSSRRITVMAASGSAKEEGNDQLGVLFVCWGNICRSPTAEAVFRDLVEKRGLQSRFKIDSAGTLDYHEGEPADARMKAAAIKRGVKITSHSRPIRPSDFEDFDIILAMDKKNEGDIMKAHKQWSKVHKLPPKSENKVKLMCTYCKEHTEKEVPDPYYGGPEGFEKVLDLLEDACESLLDSLVPNVEQNSG